MLGLEDRVRVRLVTKRSEEDNANRKMERMKRKNTRELEWTVRKEENRFKEMVENLSKMALGDRMERMQLEEMMSRLGLEDTVDVGDVQPWEVEEDRLVEWLSIQDRLGLGPGNGDV